MQNRRVELFHDIMGAIGLVGFCVCAGLLLWVIGGTQ